MNPRNDQSCAADPVAKKQATAKKLIGLYFRQLIEGCGNKSCTNDFCVSSGKMRSLSRDEAAAEALALFRCHAKLCDNLPSKEKRIESLGDVKKEDLVSSQNQSIQNRLEISSADINIKDNKMEHALPSDPLEINLSNEADVMDTPRPHLNEELLNELIEKCKQESSYLSLSSTIFKVFSSSDSLKLSFLRSFSSKNSSNFMLKNNSNNKKNLTKEDIRSMEVDQDKDEDSKEMSSVSNLEMESSQEYSDHLSKSDEVTVDIESVQRSFSNLFALPDYTFHNAMVNAIIIICQDLELDLKYNRNLNFDPDLLNIFIIIMEIPMLEFPEYLESALPAFCKTLVLLPLAAQAKLARIWSKCTPNKLKRKVDTIEQLITIRVITAQFTENFYINYEDVVVAATKVLKILYCANILGGITDREDVLAETDSASENCFSGFLHGAMALDLKAPKEIKKDSLFDELGIIPLLCNKPLIPFEEFYNEPLSDQLEMHRDFYSYKNDTGVFSFMNHAFILTPAVKALGLYYDNRIAMFSERRLSVFQSFVHGVPPNPYLKLHVRRDNLIDDTLAGLEVAAMENPSNLKKQLVVEFEGEQGIDEGGISKEFFQLIVEELFNPDYAMFAINQETNTYWFNPTSFESDAQFTLVGIILGLAIYNNVILDVHFSMVVYKKLLGRRGTFHDLADWNPSLYRGLQELLAYTGDDIEEVFMQTFRISYQDVFGTVLFYDLKSKGDQISVNHENKEEMVELYADFLLNKSIECQFGAFCQGFQMVTGDSPLKALFRPEEIELLVCGSQNFDFSSLEEATEYDGGYSDSSPIIKWFWELVQGFTLDQKRKLLQFATGSDRAPVGGLAKLKLVIARSGPDTERLPTAHTCFNVLLLPDYASKEKLQERLLKAINYSKGFGML